MSEAACFVELIETPIDAAALSAKVFSVHSGATVIFLGTTRKYTQVGNTIEETSTLYYEGYREMASESLENLARAAAQRWGLSGVAVVHRLGEVHLGEASIGVAVSSPHRREAFEACAWLMDQVKTVVPIWKQDQGPHRPPVWVHPGIEEDPAP